MRRALVAGVALAALSACAGPTARPETAELGVVRDVLMEEVAPVQDWPARWPAVVLVGDADSLEAVLTARADLATRVADGALLTLVDAVDLDALGRPALEAELVEAALENGGPILVDDADGVARRLSGVAARPAVVRLAADGRVLARLGLVGATEADLAVALGEAE